MSGERSVFFTEMAERGARRVVERLTMIADRYGAPVNPNDEVITLSEMLQHYENVGHMPGDDSCGDAICEKARRMVAAAIAAIAAMNSQQSQGGS